MPRIYDNIETKLIDGLRKALRNARACSFCVGYLNLRGWDQIADDIEGLPNPQDRDQTTDDKDIKRLKGGDKSPVCRLLVGMHRAPEEEMKLLYQAISQPSVLDGPTRAMLLKRFVESFKRQIEFGVPSDHAEDALRRLAKQLKEGKVIVKAFLRYPLHAKLYLVHRYDRAAPLVGFVGSSNLTLAGLSQQGELNVEVPDIVAWIWQGLPNHVPNGIWDAFVVMPNHVHGTIIITSRTPVRAGSEPAPTEPASM